jgi:glyoxylase-like metal-dependent hydrolase (beta-lactamase superfamily II)
MSDLELTIVRVTPLEQNCSIVACTDTKKCAVVDPGGDVERILAEIKKRGLTVEKIWITHGHFDHGGGAAALKAATGAPIEGPHIDDKFWADGIPQHGLACGVTGLKSFTPDRWLNDGDTVTLSGTPWKVIHCPGHSPGSVTFYNPDANLAFVGDVLFRNSIGRADLPGGSARALINSITQKLWPLGDVTFIPGHGGKSSFAEERQTNPFVADKMLKRF